MPHVVTLGPKGTPILNGVLSFPHDPITKAYPHVTKTPHHYIKESIDERSARDEVSGARFMRKLGIHEVPEHHYASVGGKHFVISNRVFGERPTAENIKASPQRLTDIIGAERYVGVADRHKGQYVVNGAGGVHPVDFEQSFHTKVPNNPVDHALLWHQMQEAHPNLPISESLRKAMVYHLPLLKAFLTHHAGTAGYRRWAKIHDAVTSPEPVHLHHLL